MTKEHMAAISEMINLNMDNLDPMSKSKSAQATAYLDRDFAFKDGQYDVENLTLLGWLLCKHWSEETQSRELWHIINPELKKFVTKREVNHVVTRLAYIAVNLNLKLIKNMPESQT